MRYWQGRQKFLTMMCFFVRNENKIDIPSHLIHSISTLSFFPFLLVKIFAIFCDVSYLILTHSTMLGILFSLFSLVLRKKRKTFWQPWRKMLLLGDLGVSLRLHSDAMKHKTWNICIEYLLTAKKPFISHTHKLRQLFVCSFCTCREFLSSRFPFSLKAFIVNWLVLSIVLTI